MLDYYCFTALHQYVSAIHYTALSLLPTTYLLLTASNPTS
jgi:hypothetical protein